ncbi:MAG: MFS transporter, partial [Actinobacteria bacterium]|nr:MFS transporter [Actinomycetota bacterium]
AGPGGASSVSAFWIGIGSGRIVGARLSRYLSDVGIIAWSLGLGVVLQAMLLLAHSVTAGFVSVLALGFCLGPVWPTIMSRAASAHPKQAGTVMGIVAASGCIGGGIFPSVIGYAAVSVGMRSALWTCFAAAIVNLVIFLRLFRRGN